MKKRFYFRNSKTLDLCEVVAEDSDQALLSCLEKTGWKLTRLIYEGSLPLKAQEGRPGEEGGRGRKG